VVYIGYEACMGLSLGAGEGDQAKQTALLKELRLEYDLSIGALPGHNLDL
jgi:hypothetical protein